MSEHWQALGLCGQMDPEMAEAVFYGEHRYRANGARAFTPESIEAARRICGTCPVREQCLADALAVPARFDRHGIRAGLLPVERTALRAEPGPFTHEDGLRWTGATGTRVRPRAEDVPDWPDDDR